MNKHLLLLVASFATLLSIDSFAQTNTFPSSGNAGIGTTSPGAPLEVYKSNSGALGGQIVLNNLGVAQGDQTAITFASGSITNSRAQIQSTVEGAPYYGTLEFITGIKSVPASWTEKMRITGSGKVGIGTTNPQYGNLQIASNAGDYNATMPAPVAVRVNTAGVGFVIANTSTEYTDFASGTILKGMRGHGSVPFTISNDGEIYFSPNGSEVMRLKSGNVGIGTSSPSQKLEVSGSIKSTGLILSTGAAAGKILTSDASGNATWQSAASAGWSFDGNTVGVLKKIGTTDNYDLPFITNNTERMRVLANGSVVIGTQTRPAADAKLAVDGFIYSRKSKVTQLGWADYVFHKDYRLPSLAEVEAYIKEHKHLKDIPSAKEVEQNGLDLGDNQAALLKKIEELTLYVIEMKKEIKALQKRK